MKSALVLSGGGSRGAYEIGVWRALEELDERFSIVTGSSVGAINGAVVTQGSFELAENLWRELETSKVFDVDLNENLPPKKKLLEAVKRFGKAAALEGGAGTQALEKLLRQYIDEQKVRKSPIEFGVVAVQMDGLKPQYFWKGDMPQGSLIDYLLASSALFPAVRPHEIDGKKYIDGGYSDAMPIRMALDRGAERVIAVNIEALGKIRREKDFQNYDIKEIRSYWDLGSVLLFDPQAARQNMRIGYLDTMRAFEIYDGYAFAFCKGTLAQVTRQFYHSFYEQISLLGLKNEKHKILDSVAHAAISKRVSRRGERRSLVRGFVLDGMECAAELFGLDMRAIYTFDKFQLRLRQKLSEVILPPLLAETGGDVWQERGISALSDALELSDRKIRTKYLARLMGNCFAEKRSFNLLPVVLLMADEFSAALYLALTGLE